MLPLGMPECSRPQNSISNTKKILCNNVPAPKNINVPSDYQNTLMQPVAGQFLPSCSAIDPPAAQ